MVEKIEQELEMLENIYLDEGVVEERAKESTNNPGQVTCVLKLQPNTGFDQNKIAVILKVLFTFGNEVIPLLMVHTC